MKRGGLKGCAEEFFKTAAEANSKEVFSCSYFSNKLKVTFLSFIKIFNSK